MVATGEARAEVGLAEAVEGVGLAAGLVAVAAMGDCQNSTITCQTFTR